MQNTLFDFDQQANCRHLKHGEVAVWGGYQIRNFHGFHQSREDGCGPWRFYISGFGRIVAGEHVECTLLCIDGSYEIVPIDKRDRITVLGRKYGRENWNH